MIEHRDIIAALKLVRARVRRTPVLALPAGGFAGVPGAFAFKLENR